MKQKYFSPTSFSNSNLGILPYVKLLPAKSMDIRGHSAVLLYLTSWNFKTQP